MAENKSSDGVVLFIFLLIIIGGGTWLLWKGFRPQLTEAIMGLRSAEMAVASLWTPDDKIFRVPMFRTVDDDKALKARMGDDNARKDWVEMEFGKWKHFVRNAEASEVQNEHIRVMTYMALRPLRVPMALIFIGFFVWAMFTGPTSRFRRTLSLEGLIGDQAKMFKVIRPFVKFNPNDLPIRPPGSPVPIDLPAFSEALSPEEWLAINEIKMDNGLDRTATEKALAKQLGPRWKGWEALPTELQVLLAGFCMKASRKRGESDDLLGSLMSCWDYKDGLKLSRAPGIVRQARKVLKDKKLSEKTLMNCNRHAYVATALLRALNTAREEGGVLSPSQFLWLRAHNRALWYPLNNLGRQAFHIEALGACSHYRAEKQVNRPIPKPRVMDGVDGLIEFFKDVRIAQPIPEVDYGSRKKPAKEKAA